MTLATNLLGRGHAVVRATLIGTVLQLGLAVSGHYERAIANLFAALGMAIALVAGCLCGRWLVGSRPVHAASAGAVVGAVCALLGILESWYLGDVPTWVIAFGTLTSAVAGSVGGLLGSLTRR